MPVDTSALLLLKAETVRRNDASNAATLAWWAHRTPDNHERAKAALKAFTQALLALEEEERIKRALTDTPPAGRA
jgi:hypothetical protein